MTDSETNIEDVVVSVDTGGTFTDLLCRTADGQVRHLKVASTPEDPGRALLNGLSQLGLRRPREVRHGSTVATNALLERRGARVFFLTDRGFEDLLILGRQARPELYALHVERVPPLAARADCIGVTTRRTATSPPDLKLPGLPHLDDIGVAICLLDGPFATEDEALLEAQVRAAWPDVPVSVSRFVSACPREYERASTTVMDAYVGPIMQRYLGRLTEALPGSRLSIMVSSGGLVPAASALDRPISTALSGPAGGVLGAAALGRRLGRSALLAVDMGGTSTDVAVITEAVAPEDGAHLAGLPLALPMLRIETVGAGGGSIAYLDEIGTLRVGPRSAGAVPGPASYGRGGKDPTVTDACVVLGRVKSLLGGELNLDVAAAEAALDTLAAPLGLPRALVASRILDIAVETMVRACRRVSVERGHDPRDLSLLAFGGAGGLVACALADALGCKEVIFPAEPGLLSAQGILDAPLITHAARALHWRGASLEGPALSNVAASLLSEVEARHRGPKHDQTGEAFETELQVELRYVGQSHSISLRVSGTGDTLGLTSLGPTFEAEHRQRFGYALEAGHALEVVTLTAFARSVTPSADPATEAEDGPLLFGPAVVSRYSATLFVPAGFQARTLASGEVLCTRTSSAKAEPPEVPEPFVDAARSRPLDLEIHRQRLECIAEEMGELLMRAAFSANIKERRDFSCALFDAKGRMIEHAAHIPVHLGSTPLSVAAARAHLEAHPEVMRDGVEVILNDPFMGGTHLPDVTLVKPVFLGDSPRPSFYVANRAHHADVGGETAGSFPVPRLADGTSRALTIDDEGFRMGPTVLDDHVRERFASASRRPEDRAADLSAQTAANRAGVAALRALVSRHGLAHVEAMNEALLDDAELRIRAAIRALPDGEYAYTDALDDDGYTDEPVPITVRLSVKGDELTVDFRDAPPQTPGSMNAVRAITESATYYVLRCLAGDEMPSNAGLMRPVTLLTTPGTLLDAVPNAAVSAGNVETSQRLVDVLFGALAQAAPDRVPAASCGSMNNVLFGGQRPDGRVFVHYETLGGGAGASSVGPGCDAIHVHMTNTLNTPIEALERDFPVRIEAYSVREPAPQGAEGDHPGGRGLRRVYLFDCEAEVTVVSERRRQGAPGLWGARAGAVGVNTLLHADGRVESLPGKVTVRVKPGDRLSVETPGGGGWRRAPASEDGR